MWYIEISFEKWLKMHPFIRYHLQFTCPKCLVVRDNPSPFIRKNLIGVRFKDCEKCGQRGEMIVCSKSKEMNKKLTGILFNQ